MFLTSSETFLLRKQCFQVCPHVFKCSQHEKHCFPDIRQLQVKTMFWNYSANINNSLRFVRANASQKMFPSLPTLV